MYQANCVAGDETDRRVVAVALAIIVLAPAAAAGTRQYGELVLRVAMQDDMKGTNPLTVSDVWTWNVLRYIFDGPINMDPDTEELIPYIAIGSANESTKTEGWTWDDCTIGNFNYNPKDTWDPQGRGIGEAVIFYDFEDVVWHDGTQMTIRDILFSMHMAAQVAEWSYSMNPLKHLGGQAGSNYETTHYLYVEKVYESDDGLQAALKFELQEPYADFFRDTISTFLLPYHIWGSRVSGQDVDNAKIWIDDNYDPNAPDTWKVAAATSYDNNPPIGSGPFKFESWDKGQFIRIDTFRDHFYRADYKYKDYVGTDEYGRSNARQPNIDAVAYSIYKTAEAAVLALKNDDIDYIAWSVPPSFVQELSGTPNIAMVQSPEPGFFYLAYNMRKPSFGYNEAGEDVGKPLRQAIAHCIDKERIVMRLLLNLGVAGAGPVSPLSEWHNASVPTYDFNVTKAKQILADAGYGVKIDGDGDPVYGEAAIEAAGPGNWWVNPDGSDIGSSAGGKIEILAPEANYDPIKAQRGLMIAQQLRDVGIYAEGVAMYFGSILDRIDQRDFDMYTLNWRIGSEPADYLHAFYHSSNAAVGQNYAGYRNESFDEIIDRARATEDLEQRKQLVFEAQASICYDLPNDVLYYRTNIEAYRSDRFIGWVVGKTGSIFNWQSLLNIRVPGPWKLNARFVSPPSAIAEDKSETISILVKDQDGEPLRDAHVFLNASIGTLSFEEGFTGSNGRLDVTFTAPHVSIPEPDSSEDDYQALYDRWVEDMDELKKNGTTATITIEKAEYTSPSDQKYDAAPSRLAMIRVFPEGAEFLSVTLSADPDIIDPDISEDDTLGFTFVEVMVANQDGDPVSGANVALFVSPEEPSITPETQTTDSNGKAVFTVTATDLPDNDDSVKEFILTAVAIHPTNPSILGENHMTLWIVDAVPVEPPPPPPEFPVAEAAVTLAAICMTAVALALLCRRKRP